MSVKTFLLWLGVAGLASFGAWCVVLLYIDPTESGSIGISLFYATLACWLFTVLSLIGLVVRIVSRRLKHETAIAFRLMTPTLRQALWCTAIVILSLMLASYSVFSWITAGLLIVFFTLLEGFLFSLQKQPTQSTLPTETHDTPATAQ